MRKGRRNGKMAGSPPDAVPGWGSSRDGMCWASLCCPYREAEAVPDPEDPGSKGKRAALTVSGRFTILLALAAVSANYVYFWIALLHRDRAARMVKGQAQAPIPSLLQLATGFLTNFFD